MQTSRRVGLFGLVAYDHHNLIVVTGIIYKLSVNTHSNLQSLILWLPDQLQKHHLSEYFVNVARYIVVCILCCELKFTTYGVEPALAAALVSSLCHLHFRKL